MLRKIQGLFLFVLVVSIVSCDDGQKPADEGAAMTAETVEETVEMEDEEEYTDFPFILPSPLQIASIFKKSGLTYQPDVANSASNIGKYESKLSKSLNFGVYGADLSYCVLNNQTQPAMEYMKSVRQLADDLGISSIFNSESLFNSFERNIGVEDSLIDILATIQEKLDEHLEESGTEYMSAVYFTGGWIEAMHIGGQVIDNDKKGRLVIRLVEQMTILDMLVRGLEYNPNKNSELSALVTDLESIKDIYDNFEAVKAMGEDGDIPDEGLTISDAEIDQILAQITTVRNKIVNG